MNLNDWVLFCQIVDAGGLIAASRKLGVPKSTLSRRLSQLENDFGARLLMRRGRSFELTDAGHLFYPEAHHLAKQVEKAQNRLAEGMQREGGVIKMAAPRMPGATFLGAWLAEFLALHPHIRVELDLSDTVVHLLDQGYDLALRVGPMTSSSLISRRLSNTQRILVASKHYLALHGQPASPHELKQFDCISFGEQSSGRDLWFIKKEEQTQRISFKPVFRCDDMATILQVTQSGGGIALIPVFVCQDLLEQGELQQVLPHWHGPEAVFYLVYPEKDLMPARVRLLLEFLLKKAERE
ncbi:MAG: LysR family transcriptional regulator [Cocleimonas sp.]|nr:LysR family transcriptional regulator [Cocleimonas sp.]